jgi:hypothetical protein
MFIGWFVLELTTQKYDDPAILMKVSSDFLCANSSCQRLLFSSA